MKPFTLMYLVQIDCPLFWATRALRISYCIELTGEYEALAVLTTTRKAGLKQGHSRPIFWVQRGEY